MALRTGIALAIYLGVVSTVSAQVVRFETSLGSFDMVLNPTNNSRLQGHVENMLQYVRNGNYNGSWINRADGNFVLQMGGFHSHTVRLPLTIDSTRPVAAFNPVIGQPGITGLSNTPGTVSLALSGGAGGTNRNSGTSSFFVNLASNTFLDTDFTVFAAISDMTVINQIMALTAIDRTEDPLFGADPGNLGFTDVPVQTDGRQVFIKRAFVLSETTAIARAQASVQSVLSQSLSNGGGFDLLNNSAALAESGGSAASSGLPVVSAVPEPSSLLAALSGMAAFFALSRRSVRRR